MNSDFEAVLDLADRFSTDKSSAMAMRDDIMARIEARLRRHVIPLAEALGIAVPLEVKAGGRQSNYSPVPWVRIYSKIHSPNAMTGYYIAYLFAADGSSVYLSILEGTSEYRSGAMRPVNDRRLLRSRAAEARERLEDLALLPAPGHASLAIDLAPSSVAGVVGTESRRRIRNYEDANVWAWRYSRGAIPNEDVLLADLSDALPLLAELYRLPSPSEDVAPGDGANGPGHEDRGRHPAPRSRSRTRQRSQGRLTDSRAIRAIEIYAEDRAKELLEAQGWAVKRIGHLHRGYDLHCLKDDAELHVEVKGTQSTGEEVKLTGNEVRHVLANCDSTASHALFVASGVEVGPSPDYACRGGSTAFLVPWAPDGQHLTVTEYRYRVPSTNDSAADDGTR